MATNRTSGDNRRHGAIKQRSQVFNPKIEQWVKRDTNTGKFMEVNRMISHLKELKKKGSYGT